MKKEQVYISHILFPWETFPAQGKREKKERTNDGERWTDEFMHEVRKNILKYSEMEDSIVRNHLLNETYKLVPFHFRAELFAGIDFPVWS